VGVLDGFFSTWSNAKATFGEGTPQGGAQFDGSGALNQLKSNLDSAAPGSRWTGTAATA
jgi:EspA/EspE family